MRVRRVHVLVCVAGLLLAGCSVGPSDETTGPQASTTPAAGHTADGAAGAAATDPTGGGTSQGTASVDLTAPPQFPTSEPSVAATSPRPGGVGTVGAVVWRSTDAPDAGGVAVEVSWVFDDAALLEFDVDLPDDRVDDCMEVTRDSRGREVLVVARELERADRSGPQGSFDGDVDGGARTTVDLQVYDMATAQRTVDVQVGLGADQQLGSCTSPLTRTSDGPLDASPLILDDLRFPLDGSADMAVDVPDAEMVLAGDRHVLVTEQDGWHVQAFDHDTDPAFTLPVPGKSREPNVAAVDDGHVLVTYPGSANFRDPFVGLVDVADGTWVWTSRDAKVDDHNAVALVGDVLAAGGLLLDARSGEPVDDPLAALGDGFRPENARVDGEWRVASDVQAPAGETPFGFHNLRTGEAFTYTATSSADEAASLAVSRDHAVVVAGTYAYGLDLGAQEELWSVDVAEMVDVPIGRLTAPQVTSAGVVLEASTDTHEDGLMVLLSDR